MSGLELNWIVCVSDEGLGTIDDLARRIAAMGVHVSRVMRNAGVIRCRCSQTVAGEIRSLDGVSAVEREATAYPSENEW